MREAEAKADLAFVAENVPAAFDAILDGTARVTNLVRAMKEFGHPDQGEKSEMDINRALKNTLTISSNELKFVAEAELDLQPVPLVLCYPSDLNQVFLNLLINAAHAIGEVVSSTGGKGRIKISSRFVNDAVVVSISDTGNGIPEAVRSRIFDPFFTTKEVGRGTGQGLAIARMIVIEKHHGTLTFDTETGKGTTFHVTIPAAPS
jgi:two-component system NtrC family sensor kinase